MGAGKDRGWDEESGEGLIAIGRVRGTRELERSGYVGYGAYR